MELWQDGILQKGDDKMSVTEREIQKELREHPWASREVAIRIALDHRRMRTTTKGGKRLYMRNYMRERRKERSLPSLSDALDLGMVKRKKK